MGFFSFFAEVLLVVLNYSYPMHMCLSRPSFLIQIIFSLLVLSLLVHLQTVSSFICSREQHSELMLKERSWHLIVRSSVVQTRAQVEPALINLRDALSLETCNTAASPTAFEPRKMVQKVSLEKKMPSDRNHPSSLHWGKSQNSRYGCVRSGILGLQAHSLSANTTCKFWISWRADFL